MVRILEMTFVLLIPAQFELLNNPDRLKTTLFIVFW